MNWLRSLTRLLRRPQDGSVSVSDFEAKTDDNDEAIEKMREHQDEQARRLRSIEASRDVLRRRFPS